MKKIFILMSVLLISSMTMADQEVLESKSEIVRFIKMPANYIDPNFNSNNYSLNNEISNLVVRYLSTDKTHLALISTGDTISKISMHKYDNNPDDYQVNVYFVYSSALDGQAPVFECHQKKGDSLKCK